MDHINTESLCYLNISIHSLYYYSRSTELLRPLGLLINIELR